MTFGLDLEPFSLSVRTQVDQHLDHCLSPDLSDVPVAAPRLLAAMKYAALGGGKRIRPLLCFASAQLFDKNPLENTAVLHCASSIELIHAYSLVHDDLPAMDNDDLRRGRATTHKEFDEATAILAGDALQTLAFAMLANCAQMSADARVKSIQLLAKASGQQGMAGGQMIDIQSVGSSLQLQQLVEMHGMKTGALIGASVMLGSIASGCQNPQQLEALRSYGLNIGLAFQIQDDILDCTTSTKTLGKQQGADAELGKPTYVSLLGLDGAREKLRLAHDNALASLSEFEQNSLLAQMADYIVGRTH